MKRILILLSSLFLIILTSSCASLNTTTLTTTKSTTTADEIEDYTGYYMENFENPLKDLDMGGYDSLTLIEDDNNITLENKKTRIILNKNTGGIKELANKEAHLYLAKNVNSIPISYGYISSDDNTSYKSFSYNIENDDNSIKKINLTWTLSNNEVLNASISLKEDDNEITFNAEINNISVTKPIYYIEYPIVDGIDSLYDKKTDYLAHPIATGYLFRNPLDNFNSKYHGIDREMGLYPSGWETTMQFYAYYSEGIGGFLFRTKDGKDTIKSFSFVGKNRKLKASIYHYVDDISKTSMKFDYDISIGNLNEGRWEEAAEIYKDWATDQDWVIKGKRIDRTDIDKAFYEETVLCNFSYPYAFQYSENNQKSLYEKMKSNINGKILNVYFVNDGIISLAHKYDDYLVHFEFPDFIPVDSLNGSEVLDRNSQVVKFNLNGVYQGYECPTDSGFVSRLTAKENDLKTQYDVSGYYHDVGVAAVHPKQCFNTRHSHGTRINLISDYIDQMAYMKELSKKNGSTIYGQELIFEQMIPYIDFYQSRASSLNLGFMEGDRFNDLIINGDCRPNNMFDYIYMEYTGVRLDGFLLPDDRIKDAYYYIAEYTVIHGGIPEYNYEFIDFTDFLSPDEQSEELMQYIDYLGIVRQTFGFNYLVYGTPKRAPKFETEKISYSFNQSKNVETNRGNGRIIVDKLIASSYEYDGNIGIFFANSTNEIEETDFVLDAYRYYGIKNGSITYVDEDGYYTLSQVKNGLARISLTVKPRKVVMLEIRGK